MLGTMWASTASMSEWVKGGGTTASCPLLAIRSSKVHDTAPGASTAQGRYTTGDDLGIGVDGQTQSKSQCLVRVLDAVCSGCDGESRTTHSIIIQRMSSAICGTRTLHPRPIPCAQVGSGLPTAALPGGGWLPLPPAACSLSSSIHPGAVPTWQCHSPAWSWVWWQAVWILCLNCANQ